MFAYECKKCGHRQLSGIDGCAECGTPWCYLKEVELDGEEPERRDNNPLRFVCELP